MALVILYHDTTCAVALCITPWSTSSAVGVPLAGSPGLPQWHSGHCRRSSGSCSWSLRRVSMLLQACCLQEHPAPSLKKSHHICSLEDHRMCAGMQLFTLTFMKSQKYPTSCCEQECKTESVHERNRMAASTLLKRLNWSVVLGLPATAVHWFRALPHWKQAAQLLCASPGWFAEP